MPNLNEVRLTQAEQRDTPDEPERLAPEPQFVIAAPHSEPALVAIARAAILRNQLSRFITPLHTGRLSVLAARIPPERLGGKLAREFGRRSFSGIPDERIELAAPLSQALYVAVGRLPRTPATASLTSALFFRSKERFDAAVQRRLRETLWDVVIANDLSAELTLKAARELDRFGVLNFVDNHPHNHNRLLKELCGLQHPHREVRTPRSVEGVERELELAHLILVPSRIIARQLNDAGIAAGRVVVQPFGVDLSAFLRESPDRRSSRRGRLRCLYVGSISFLKGIGFLLEVARRLRNRPVEFQIVGRIVSPEVLERIPENVQVSGPVVHAEVVELMKQADVFMMPSLQDAFGLVTVEAMAAGLPIVCSNNVGASELITDGSDGLLVPPGNIPALAEAIERLLETEDLRFVLGEAARRRAEHTSSWDDYGRSVLAHVAQRVAGGPAGATE